MKRTMNITGLKNVAAASMARTLPYLPLFDIKIKDLHIYLAAWQHVSRSCQRSAVPSLPLFVLTLIVFPCSQFWNLDGFLSCSTATFQHHLLAEATNWQAFPISLYPYLPVLWLASSSFQSYGSDLSVFDCSEVSECSSGLRLSFAMPLHNRWIYLQELADLEIVCAELTDSAWRSAAWNKLQSSICLTQFQEEGSSNKGTGTNSGVMILFSIMFRKWGAWIEFTVHCMQVCNFSAF